MRTLIVGRCQDFADRPFDGFVKRHHRLVDVASQVSDVHLLGLRGNQDSSKPAPSTATLPWHELALPARRHTRMNTLAGWHPDEEFATRLQGLAADIEPDVVVTLGPWLDEEYEPLFRCAPVIHLFEEDVTQMAELASQRWRARVLRAAGASARRLRSAHPAYVVVISEHEVGRARRRYGRKPVYHVLPLTLHPSWPVSDTRSNGQYLICVGVLSEQRNAEPLAPVLEELQHLRRPEGFHIRLVSQRLHDVLLPALGYAWVVHDDAVTSPVELYRTAHMALVPAARATGVKETILQAWSSGCPVVAHSGSARTVALAFADAMIVAGRPHDLAAAIIDEWNDGPRLDHLFARGREAMLTTYDDNSAMIVWRRLLFQASQQRRSGYVNGS